MSVQGYLSITTSGSPETVIINVGTNDLRTTRNLDLLMGERTVCFGGYGVEEAAELRIVLSGVLRRSDVSWRRIGALNGRLDWTGLQTAWDLPLLIRTAGQRTGI